MKNQLINAVLWLSVFFLAFEAPFATIASQNLKFWMLPLVIAGVILFWQVYQKGLGLIKRSKILVFGLGFIFFSLLGLINSPQPGYSLKQIVVLAALIVLATFFELYSGKRLKFIYSALAAGILLSAIAGIYQNIAFELGWPHFEAMAARPNAFFPEADWLGLFLALGLVPFLVWVGKDRQKSKLPKILHNKSSFYLFLLLTVTALIVTVARASWLALIAEMGVITVLSTVKLGTWHLALGTEKYKFPVSNARFLKIGAMFVSLIIISLTLINVFHLSRFNISDRFRSIFFQEHVITVAQDPITGKGFKINLEEIEIYRAQGYLIKENYVADENVASRGERATSAWDTIKSHPILGSGLGITLINTNFKHNANNLFLEWWASAGLGALLLIIGLLLYLVYRGILLIKKDFQSAIVVLAGTTGFIIVNLFNASIFLAFAWFYLALSLIITEHKTRNT